ncbi:13017_t:CDS:2 [Acaulospora morrowiae]|uniref:13017_t:CDS:1 n=1 Tax=Acaulospora morrowiae TaxID=94023 RepID=A0A9N9GNY6_9GLOM|nr:13017_t:CDS:2 [Acaulospora morrowiae]
MEELLKSEGWYLSEDGLADIRENLEVEQPSLGEIIKEALNTDLRSISRGILPRDLTNQKSITGPLVLQLLSIINLSTPAQNQQVTPRLFQLTFTDGVKKIKGIEILGEVEDANLNTPPGTKFLVTSEITLENNFLHLGPGLLRNLGGEVEEMIKEWKVGRQFITRSRASVKKDGEVKGGDDGPPPFVPFKIKDHNRQTVSSSSNAQVEGEEIKGIEETEAEGKIMVIEVELDNSTKRRRSMKINIVDKIEAGVEQVAETQGDITCLRRQIVDIR